MFKINKLNSISNENVVIDYVVHDVYFGIIEFNFDLDNYL